MGPETGFLDRMRAEVRARGITLLVIRAPYSRQLPARLVASVRGELAALLQDSQVRLEDVRIEYGRITSLIHPAR